MKLLIISGPYEADRLRKAAVSAGFEAVAVEPGESLSGWITASRPTLIVMAPQMVHADPVQALAKVRSVPRGRVPIFLVGDGADEPRMAGLADGFFIRPVAPDELLARARAVLSASPKDGNGAPRARARTGARGAVAVLGRCAEHSARPREQLVRSDRPDEEAVGEAGHARLIRAVTDEEDRHAAARYGPDLRQRLHRIGMNHLRRHHDQRGAAGRDPARQALARLDRDRLEARRHRGLTEPVRLVRARDDQQLHLDNRNLPDARVARYALARTSGNTVRGPARGSASNLRTIESVETIGNIARPIRAVSYTHLRAHETPEHLV